MISRKILMMKGNDKIWMFLLEDDEIVEIHCEPESISQKPEHVLGNIYVGRVKNIAQNIGAAFIEIEPGRECYYDMSQAKQAFFTKKAGQKPLCIGDELLVQISKEAVKTKAPTVSSNLSFTGRYAVLTTGNNRIGTSGKLPKALKEAWKERLQYLKNEEFGVIVRTNAKDVEMEVVQEEITELLACYKNLCEHASMRTVFSCLHQALPPYIANLRNVYTEGLEEIIVEGESLFHEVEDYYEKEAPEFLTHLRHYRDESLSLAKLYQTDTCVSRALNQRVWLRDGAYLVIQYTEALTVIDVNSGKCVSKKKPAETYRRINLDAAKEVAKQLRLRNISGIVIVDFINLDEPEATKELLKTFRLFLAKDPIQATLVDLTALQLVEVTRKKVRKPFYEIV